MCVELGNVIIKEDENVRREEWETKKENKKNASQREYVC